MYLLLRTVAGGPAGPAMAGQVFVETTLSETRENTVIFVKGTPMYM